MIRVLRSHNCGGGWNPQNMLSRYLTTARESEMNLDVENTLTKRFATPRKPRQLKPIKQPFGVGLFTGIFDKNIFKYPRILANEEIISVVQQSIELENYLNKLKPHSTNFKNILKDLNHVEMFGLTVPQKYGGLGYTETEAKFIEECSSINPLVAQMLGTNENFVAKILTLLGSEEQKLKYLPKLATGEKIFSFAYLEDGPIVDLNSLETNCVRDETTNCYIINGNKKWVPNADISDHIIVLSKELDISEETVQLIFCFCIVDKNTPGITIHKFKSGTAKDFNLCEVEFKNVRIPMDNCVGNDKENSYSVFIKTLSHNQLSASVACLAALKRILHSVVQHCENKTLNGKSLEEHSFIQGSVGYLTMYTYALESVTYFMCGMLDKFENPDLIMEANIAKVFIKFSLHFWKY